MIEEALSKLADILSRGGYKQFRNTPDSMDFTKKGYIVRVGKFVSMLWVAVERERHQGVANNGIAFLFKDILAPSFEKEFTRLYPLLQERADHGNLKPTL